MKKVEYSLIVRDKLKNLRKDLSVRFGKEVSRKAVKKITEAARGLGIELNAGYLDGKMHFEVNSYNNWNIGNESKLCNIQF